MRSTIFGRVAFALVMALRFAGRPYPRLAL